jgi:poly(A) polymerase Pap1
VAKIYARELQELCDELDRALRKQARFNSEHEGYAKILEELDELWEEIKRRQSKRRPKKMRREAFQVAASVMRLILERMKA